MLCYREYARATGLFRFRSLSAIVAISIVLVALQSTFKQQVLAGNFPMRLRWNFHRLMLGQSMGFYGDEFAGRVAAKVMQTALAVRDVWMILCDILVFIVIYFVTLVLVVGSFNAWMLLPLLGWLGQSLLPRGVVDLAREPGAPPVGPGVRGGREEVQRPVELRRGLLRELVRGGAHHDAGAGRGALADDGQATGVLSDGVRLAGAGRGGHQGHAHGGRGELATDGGHGLGHGDGLRGGRAKLGHHPRLGAARGGGVEGRGDAGEVPLERGVPGHVEAGRPPNDRRPGDLDAVGEERLPAGVALVDAVGAAHHRRHARVGEGERGAFLVVIPALVSGQLVCGEEQRLAFGEPFMAGGDGIHPQRLGFGGHGLHAGGAGIFVAVVAHGADVEPAFIALVPFTLLLEQPLARGAPGIGVGLVGRRWVAVPGLHRLLQQVGAQVRTGRWTVGVAVEFGGGGRG